jgi:hypothetical protein
MKEKLSSFILVVLMFVSIAGCTIQTDSDADSVVQVNTPAPTPVGGTPVPDDEIKVPGVSINLNAPGPNPSVNTPDDHGVVAGALLGLWHGVISPITLVMSFFNRNVQMYEVHNNGREYNLGFLLGIAILLIIVVFSTRR